MSKFISMAKSPQKLISGGAVLALGLVWPFLTAAQNKSDQDKDTNPHAQHQERQSAGGPMPGMKMPGRGGQKQESAWWYDNYTRSQKQGLSGKRMAGEGDMVSMPGMMKGKKTAESMPRDGSSPGMGMIDDVDLMGMMTVGMNPMGTLAPDDKGANSLAGMGELKMTSSQPGSPGVSRLYHIGATEFFLNHSEHVTLTTKQQAALNHLKQKAQLSKFTAQRKIEEAEQELWELTGGEELDAAQIQATVRAIEKLRGEQRIAFILSVGEAAKVLTDEQRQMLLGTVKPDASGASDH